MKEINEKFYNEVDVVLLPTVKQEEVGDIVLNTLYTDGMAVVTKTNISKENEDVFRFGHTGITFKSYRNKGLEAQHLYFLSDDTIREGDWCFLLGSKLEVFALYKYNSIFHTEELDKEKFKKIIASTNRELTFDGVKQIPLEFIEKYADSYFNVGVGFEKVLVEYQRLPIPEWMLSHADKLAKEVRGGDTTLPRYTLKTNESAVIIKM